MRRSVGYCINTECERYTKGDFLLHHGSYYTCGLCRQPGHLEREFGVVVEEGYQADAPFREVRVRYNFYVSHGGYSETAVIIDESLPQGNTYILQTPLVKTESRALKVAEAILGNLNRYGFTEGEVPTLNEKVLYLDEPLPEFQRSLEKLAEELNNSKLGRAA